MESRSRATLANGCVREGKRILSALASAAFPLPNTDDVLKEVSLKYVTRYREEGGRV